MIKNHPIYYPLYNDKEKFVILITGGRGSGKSYAASAFIERLTFEKTPITKIVHQILYTRYTMVSANISIIPEMMEKIEADGTDKYFKATRTDIVNKLTSSRIMFRGIKTSSGVQTAKLKSIQGITTFVCDEAEEFTSEEDYDKIMLSIRKKGIQNRIIIIMNPCDSNHFIYKKYIEKTHKLVEIDGVPVQISTHPNVLHIHTTYFDNMDNLSPEFLKEVQDMKENNPEKYAHVVIGRWADVAEGAVFKKWGIVDEFPQECKKVGIGLDFGFSIDPTAAVRCGIVDGRLYLDEITYQTGMLSTDIVKTLRPWGLKTIADSADPRLIQEIHNGGVRIYAVAKGAGSINAGIDKMQSMEIFVTKRSYNLQKELRNYVWAKDKDGRYINEPEDANNHCFVGNTMVMTIGGERRIDTFKKGDIVLTSQGYKKVTNFFNNGCRKVLCVRMFFSKFMVEIEGTPDHKIKTEKGWKQLQELTKGDVLYTFKSSTAKNISYTKVKDIFQEEQKGCIEKSGSSITEKFRLGIMCITKMKIHGTTISKTLNLSKCQNILACICENICNKKDSVKNSLKEWITRENLQTNGMVQKKVGTGIANMQKNNLKTRSLRHSFANIVAKNLTLSRTEAINSVQTSVEQHIGIIPGLTTKNENANGAEKSSLQISTAKLNSVVENAPGNTPQALELKGIEIVREDTCNVYDLEVEESHEYFANGILVHNCIDAARYYVLGELLGRIQKPKSYDGIFTH